eukprot:gnl/TRDRNA2_/TRDRNA2_69193_c0_seq1.p1 gnl/TRDRNA2_/TRDRNA2_69193_c0~~gnl/TRDRNA2_/TRDRNA2_69193_c0_seq1.p1  ORF type:complete len:136 (+),score=10.24 gnl/TRDRNA2_/TRDRNA2_69193_c0_seq1:60-467(+)
MIYLGAVETVCDVETNTFVAPDVSKSPVPDWDQPEDHKAGRQLRSESDCSSTLTEAEGPDARSPGTSKSQILSPEVRPHESPPVSCAAERGRDMQSRSTAGQWRCPMSLAPPGSPLRIQWPPAPRRRRSPQRPKM